MKRSFIIFVLILSSLSSSAPFAHAVGSNRAQQKRMDLGLTLKFIQGWSNRDKWDKFPESPSFAYYNVYSMKVLKSDIGPELRKKIVDYIKSCQMKDGGFTAGPDRGKDSNTVFTYYALATLDLLNSLDTIDRKKAAGYIRTLVQSNGGIKAKATDSRATLATTYYGIASLALLNAVDTINKDTATAYINSYREKGKGFCMVQGTISLPGSTFMAVRSIILLGGMTPDIKADVVAYLKGSRYSGRVKDRKYTTLPSIEEMSSVLETLADLSSLQIIDKRSVHKFIESLYIPENGGFGPEPGLGTTPPSTYYALACLEKIGEVPRTGRTN